MSQTPRTVSIGDVRLAVEDRGACRSGEPVLLLVHGFPLDHAMWRAQIDYFGARGRVVAPDLRGFGGSSTSATAAVVQISTYADDLAALLDRLDINGPIVFCGLSMGGYIAWQFCAKYASRLAALVVCDTRSADDTPQAVTGRFVLAARVVAEGIEPVAAAMLPKLFAPGNVERQPSFVADTAAVIRRASPIGIAEALVAMAGRPDMTASLGEIRLPTLAVVGEHDAISPVEEMRGIAERIRGAEFVVIPGAGHMSPLEEPTAFNAALERFLRQRAGWT